MPIGQQYIPRLPSQSDPGSVGNINDAFGALTNAVGGLMVNRSIRQASDAVQQIDSQEASDTQKNQLKTQLGNALGAQLIQYGMPANHAQILMNQFQPQQQADQPSSEFELLQAAAREKASGISNGPLNQTAQAYLSLKPTKEKAEKAEPSELDTQLKTGRLEKMQDDRITKLRGAINEFETSGRKLPGRLGQALAKIQEVRGGLLSDAAGSLNKITQGETSQALSSIFGGGVATEGATHNLIPDTLAKKSADLETLLTSKLTPYNTPTIANAYKEITDRLLGIIPAQLNEGKKKTLRAALGDFKAAGADKFSALAESQIQNPDGSLEKAYMKNGRIRFTSDDKIDELRDAAKYVMGNAKKDQRARQIFSTLKEDPFYMQALQDPSFGKLIKGAANALQAGQ